MTFWELLGGKMGKNANISLDLKQTKPLTWLNFAKQTSFHGEIWWRSCQGKWWRSWPLRKGFEGKKTYLQSRQI